MENITIDSLNLQEESDEHAVNASQVGRDYVGRTYQKEETDDHVKVSSEDQAKPQSSFRARFGSKSTHEESSDLLDKGIVPRSIQEKSSEKGSFQDAMKKINGDVALKDRDKALGQLFTLSVNPGKIPDGHCSKCAFNTHLHFIGRDLEEAEAGNTDAFVKFSKWFYMNLAPNMVECVETVDGRGDENFTQFKQRVEERVAANTKKDEAVLISIGTGSHWFNAYNDGDRIWFVDSQTGKGFNLYPYEDLECVSADECVDIVKVTPDHIDAYDSL